MEGIKHLAYALKKNNTPIEELYFGRNSIGDEEAKIIGDIMLAVNKTLQYIDLGKNNIGERGLKVLPLLYLKTLVYREYI